MKKLILALAAVALGFSASAQLSWEARLGATVSKFTEADTKMKLGMKAGIGAEYAFSDLFALRPGLFFAMKGSSRDDSFAIKSSDAFNLSYLEIPVLACFRFPVSGNFKIGINAGPYLGMRLNSATWAQVEARVADFGINAGLDFIFGRIVLAPEVEYGLTDVYVRGDDRNLAYSLSLGYRF